MFISNLAFSGIPLERKTKTKKTYTYITYMLNKQVLMFLPVSMARYIVHYNQTERQNHPPRCKTSDYSNTQAFGQNGLEIILLWRTTPQPNARARYLLHWPILQNVEKVTVCQSQISIYMKIKFLAFLEPRVIWYTWHLLTLCLMPKGCPQVLLHFTKADRNEVKRNICARIQRQKTRIQQTWFGGNSDFNDLWHENGSVVLSWQYNRAVVQDGSKVSGIKKGLFLNWYWNQMIKIGTVSKMFWP